MTARVEGQTLILSVLPNREKETVKRFLQSIPRHLRQTIHTVCCDLYDGFVNAAREVLGKRVKLVSDRFHVVKLYRSELDKLRKQELKHLKEELSDEDYSSLKGTMWALRKGEEKLTAEDDAVLIRLFEYSPKLECAYDLCDELTILFNSPLSKREGTSKLKNWMNQVRSSVGCLKMPFRVHF